MNKYDKIQELTKDISKQDTVEEGKPSMFIQWKGTDVCADLYCVCGHHGHVDGYFLYYWKCPKCSKKYQMKQNLEMYELDDEQTKAVEDWRGEIDSKGDEVEDEFS